MHMHKEYYHCKALAYAVQNKDNSNFLELPRRNFVFPRNDLMGVMLRLCRNISLKRFAKRFFASAQNDEKRKNIHSQFSIYNSLRCAFSLAEVLITLTIIGVLAAMLIPALTNYIQDQEFKTSYKKVFSIASQVNMALFNEGAYHATTEGIYNFEQFKSKFKVAKDCSSNNNSQCWESTGEVACDGACAGGGKPDEIEPAFIDASGVAWSLFHTGSSFILVDTNGDKQPNRYGKDRWFLPIHQAITTGKLTPRPDWTSATPSELDCHYPPCYSTSWLYN